LGKELENVSDLFFAYFMGKIQKGVEEF